MKSLAASFVAMIFVDTIGGVHPFPKDGSTPSFLPSPRNYLATFLLWGLLGLVAGFGESASRLAGRLGAVVLLTAAVVGPFGKRAVGFINGVSAATAATEGGTP